MADTVIAGTLSSVTWNWKLDRVISVKLMLRNGMQTSELKIANLTHSSFSQRGYIGKDLVKLRRVDKSPVGLPFEEWLWEVVAEDADEVGYEYFIEDN